MRKIDLPFAADTLFYTFSAWLLSLCVLRYYRVSFPLAAGAAVLLALGIGTLAALFLYARREKRVLTKKARAARDALLLHLALEKGERVRAALLEAFRADGSEAHCEGDCLKRDGEIAVPLYTMQPLSADAAAALLREYGKEPFTLWCNDLTPEAEKLLFSFGKKTKKGDETYALFERTGTTPSPLICGELSRRTARTKFRAAFSKRNARPYFISGALLLVMSLFTFFPVYYLLSGGILLSCAVCVRFFGYSA